jgi:hypothetical protein
MQMNQDKWHGCYEDGWQGQIVPEAFSHPAKMAYGLLQRIYDHCFDQGWLKEGDVVVDPFGGIGSTGILGAYRGVQVVSCELEAKFTGLAMHNMFLHLPKWRALGSPLPVIIQGDSRRLCELVAGADVVVSSPPYAEISTGQAPGTGEEAAARRYERLKAAGYDADGLMTPGRRKHNLGTMEHYGSTPGQLGSMKAGSVEAVISSPPYSDQDVAHIKTSKGDAHKKMGTVGHRNQTDGYGSSPGNLGNLKPGDINLIVSSPPYEGSMACGNKQDGYAEARLAHVENRRPSPGDQLSTIGRYSNGADDLGNKTGPTFWAAAKEIVQQCHQILKQGGHAVWVVKDFVRKGERVDFTGDWRRLCESIGFETVCVHHAMLVKERKMQTLFGHTHTERTERKSFFRRLAEAKGCPPINYEVVLCMQKQGREDGK